MTLYPTSAVVRVSAVTRDPAGAPVDPTALSVMLTRPDGSTRTYPAPTKDGVGQYHQDIPAADTGIAGHYSYAFLATGATGDADVFDTYDPATLTRIASLAEAKSFLRITGTGDDARLTRYLDQATARILSEVGALRLTTTDRVTLRHQRITLPRLPVQALTAVTAITPATPTLLLADLAIVQASLGLVEITTGVFSGGVYDITYTYGQTAVPPATYGATLALIRHWWNQTQSHGSATYGDSEIVTDFSGLPNTVKNMLDADRAGWGYA